ncbi:MAG: tetratricopeptide repeat protein [Elusimicrobia bacterium]|nr:tetratricopeptide repeat protein [Elusimicrobiota bacterium]
MKSFLKISLLTFGFLFFLGVLLIQNSLAVTNLFLDESFSIPTLDKEPPIPIQDKELPKPDEITLLSEKDIPRHIWVAGQYLKAGKFKSVITICAQVLNVNKNNIEAHALRSAAYKGLGNKKEFQKEAKLIKKLAPKSPAFYLYLAQTYLYFKDFKEAESTYKKGLKTSSEKTELLMGLASLNAENGQLKKASDQYLQILKEKNLAIKYFLNANFGLCRIDFKNKAYDEVIKRAKLITELYPPIPQGYLFLSSAHLAKGEINQAINVYKKLMEANPESPVSFQELVLIYNDQLGDYQNALHYAVEGARKFPKDAKSQDVLGWVYYEKKKYPEALKQFQAAIRMDKKNPYYLYHLGLAHHKMGDKAKAKETFEQALNLLDPNESKEFAKELKSQINQCK